LPKNGTVLAAVNTATRRVPRWPAASVDRRSARRLYEIGPGRRNAAQPDRETPPWFARFAEYGALK